MEYKYEVIKHQIDIPVKIFTHTVEQFPYHWHEDMEILFILKGSVEIRVDQKAYSLNEGDIFLVNQNEVHFITSNTEYGKTHLLALQFHSDYFNKYNIDLRGKKFRLNSSEDGSINAEVYTKLRHILANMMNLVLNKENLYNLHIEKLLLEMIVILLNHFELKDNLAHQRSIKSEERLLDILKYINNNCTDSKMSLQQISDYFFLNPQYLSRYFKNHVGVPLKKFIDNMRMNKSLHALQLSEDRILDIALKFGFPDAKAYYRVFKEIMGMTPMAYRELHKVEVSNNKPKDYFSINSKESLSKLFEYLEIESKIPDPLVSVDYDVQVNLDKETETFSHSFTNLLTFGYAPHGLREDFTKQLKLIQEEIKFNYVRFHGIFADELLVYNERENGEFYFNFNHIDTLLDNLLKHGVKPFIELGFMPRELASIDETIFWWKSYISPPKNMNRWLMLIDTFFKHIINRYGIEEVHSWYFEFWNEPDIEGFFWKGTQEEFLEFFRKSYDCIKAIDKDIKVGGFGNIIFTDSFSWLKNFEAYALKHQIKLDFFSFHVYNITIDDVIDNKSLLTSLISVNQPNKNLMLRAGEYGLRIGDEDYITRCIDKMVKVNDNMAVTTNESWITEWNANTDCRDLVHDTCYMAAFIVKNVIDNCNKVKGMGFWTFTDIFEEKRIEQPLFHGGFGLMTYNGIKKASYNAFYLLSKLGTEIIYKSEYMIVTKKGSDYVVMLHNYCHHNSLYSKLDYSQISMRKRYDVFKACKKLSFSVELNGIKGDYLIEKLSINREQGSSYDSWIRMGSPDVLSHDAYKHLVVQSEPSYETWLANTNGILSFDTVLEPHEVQIFQLTKKY